VLQEGDKWDSTLIIRRGLCFCMLDKESHCCTGQGNAQTKRPRLSIFPFMDTTLATSHFTRSSRVAWEYNKSHAAPFSFLFYYSLCLVWALSFNSSKSKSPTPDSRDTRTQNPHKTPCGGGPFVCLCDHVLSVSSVHSGASSPPHPVPRPRHCANML